jgi:beta-phosphoglucomutase-like phosphatase (HAD superfamily)
MSSFFLNGKIIRSVAFDMDGTLVDCEPSNREAVQNAVGSEFKINWGKYAGVKEVDILAALKQEYGSNRITIAADDFVAACKKGYKEAIKKLEPRLGMMPLLNTLKDLDIPIIIVTNSDTTTAKEKLTQCGMLDYLFDIIGADTITEHGLKAKPSGDGYILAAEMLDIKIEEMMGVEDSTTGMNALSETKALAVHIIDYGTPEHQKANIIIDGMGSGDLLALNNLIRRENYSKLLGLLPEPCSPAHA